MFWSKGNKAAVTVRGEAWPECRTVATGSQALRASGNEPGWRLEAYGPNIRFETADGGIRLSRRLGPPAVSGVTTTYTAPAASGVLTAVVSDRRCTDTMTGMPHPKSVTVAYQGKVFEGCGADGLRAAADGAGAALPRGARGGPGFRDRAGRCAGAGKRRWPADHRGHAAMNQVRPSISVHQVR